MARPNFGQRPAKNGVNEISDRPIGTQESDLHAKVVKYVGQK